METKEFLIEWLDGTSETMHGYSISDAFMKAGYGGGAIAAIDSWKEIKKPEQDNKGDDKDGSI